MQRFDLVKVIKHPERMFADILGEKGYIAFIEEDGRVDFHALEMKGQMAGQGIIPMDCLEPCSDDDLLRAYELERLDYDRRADRFERQNPGVKGFRLPKRVLAKVRKLDL